MPRFSFEEKHLGTPVHLLIVAEDETAAESLAHEAYAECARIEEQYSRFLAGNALAELNAHIGEWFPVSPELYELLEFGEKVKSKTEGAFDLSVKGLLESWGYDASYSFHEKKGTCVGAFELKKDATLCRVLLSAPIELGGLGKGYAIDRVGAILQVAKGFLINAGGDILLKGFDENGAGWRVAFEHPNDFEQAIGLFEGTDLALACSSPSRRHWTTHTAQGDHARHHLVDPRTGEPAHNMLAVYTQAPTAILADAYSTALFVLGFERARELLPTLPIEALLVGPDLQLFRTAGFKGELFS